MLRRGREERTSGGEHRTAARAVAVRRQKKFVCGEEVMVKIKRGHERRAWFYYRDGCGTLRVGGKPGRRMRRMLKRKGILVRMRLNVERRRISIDLVPVYPKCLPHVVPPRIYRQQVKAGYLYHITVTLGQVETYPAIAAVGRIMRFFGGNKKDIVARLPISYVSPTSHVAFIPKASPLQQIYGDLRYLGAQYGKHPGEMVGVSM